VASAAALAAGCCLAAATWLSAPAAPGFAAGNPSAPSFLAGSRRSLSGGVAWPQPQGEARVAMRSSGNLVPDTVQKNTPHGFKRALMKRMPSSKLSTEEMMKRITTVLIKNIDEKWRDAPMKTLEIMKEIGLRGRQIKEKKYINDALYLLMGQKVIYKVKQNPIRWEIHEEYRMDGVPPISPDKRAPWRLTHLLKFEKTKVPKYGPIHGEYRQNLDERRRETRLRKARARREEKWAKMRAEKALAAKQLETVEAGKADE